MRLFWIVAGVCCLLAAAASAAAFGAREWMGAGTTSSSAAAVPVAETPTPVRIHRVAAAEPSVRTYTGVVKPRYESDLAFRLGGKVVARTVEVGDRVKKGQVLARLDPADFRLAVEIAEADLAANRADAENAVKEAERSLRLAARGAVGRSELDRYTDGRTASEARRKRAERSLVLANNRLAYTELLAEWDGVVTALPVEVGQVVAEGTPVARIAGTAELEAVVHLPENRAEDARSAARATLWGEAGPGCEAVLRELSPTADPTARTYQARFTLRSPGRNVALGRTVTIHLGSAPAKPTVAVPLTALRRDSGGPAVWRIDGGRLQSATVVVGSYRDDVAEIVEGLRPGDLVAAAGVQKLHEGLRVQAWEAGR